MTKYSVRIYNLDETIKALNEVNDRMAKDLKSAIRDIAKPTLQKARGYAHVGAHSTGAYAHSLAIRTQTNGVKFVSTDPGAGVIEYANPGALILRGERAGRRAGVPHGSNPPRALLKAILEDENHIVSEVSNEVEKYSDFNIY